MAIPVAKEGDTLHNRIKALHKELSRLAEKHGITYEIVLVSDVPTSLH